MLHARTSSPAHLAVVAEPTRPTALLAAPRLSAVLGCTSPLTAIGVSDVTARGAVHVTTVATNTDELVGRVARQRPHLCLVVTPFRGDLADVVAALTDASRFTRTVVLSSGESQPGEVLATLRAGAYGWLPLTTDGPRLVDALRAVVRGEAAVPRALLTTVLAELRASGTHDVPLADGTSCQLPPREHDVLAGLGGGLSTTEVARQLGIGTATARGYVASAVRRLGAADRAAAIALVRAATLRRV